MRISRPAALVAAAVVVLGAGSALAAAPSHSAAQPSQPAHHPIFMRTLGAPSAHLGPKPPVDLTPPAPPCPLPDNLPRIPVPVLGEVRVGPCVELPILLALGQPFVGNMAYWGGKVQVHPHIYLVYLGWGRPDAFKNDCGAPVKLHEGTIKATLKCDPDGAGKLMADFVSQLGGTEWAGIQSQYYQEVQGSREYIHNDRNQLAGIWVDDKSPTSRKLTYRQLAQEAERAVLHFKVKDSQLTNSNFVIVQPQNFSDPLAQSSGYCAWHDMIEPAASQDYKGLRPGVPFTNMPYVLNQGTNCGQNAVNAGTAGRLDAFTLALGHEIEETVTDPGAETRINGVALGAWYDPFDGYENGDKCAYVGNDPVGGPSFAEPGATANITGNRGGKFAIQSMWSNESAAGLGYCAGAGNDVPA